MVDGIEDEFDTSRYPELVEDAEQVLLDGVLAEVEFPGSVAIAKAFGNEGDDLFFARGEELSAEGVEYAQRRHFGDHVEEKVHLLGVGPDLTGGDPLDAPAEQAEMRIVDTEDSAGA